MIQPEEKLTLEELKSQVKCPRDFMCVGAALEDLCRAEFDAQSGILECLGCHDPGPIPCPFAKPFAAAFACTCPLRIYIAQHFDQWSAESTSVLKARSG
jgi:hypothetical protein